jgi:hypothetical protein
MDSFGKCDPFVQLSLNEQTFATEHKKNVFDASFNGEGVYIRTHTHLCVGVRERERERERARARAREREREREEYEVCFRCLRHCSKVSVLLHDRVYDLVYDIVCIRRQAVY